MKENPSSGQDTGVPGKPESGGTLPSRCLDRLLLVGAALLVCVMGGAAFWFAEDYRVNPAWIFVAWNSIWLVPLFIRDFRNHLRRPSFVAFLGAWAVIHGLLVVTLMRWLSIPAMLPILAIELAAGLAAADFAFGIRPANE